MKQPSKSEAAFLEAWHTIAGPDLTPEYQFHKPRRWRFDFAHLPTQTAIEIEGGIWTRGRHNRGKGYEADCEKYNTAQLDGWDVFRLAGKWITDLDTLRRIAYHIEGQYGEE